MKRNRYAKMRKRKFCKEVFDSEYFALKGVRKFVGWYNRVIQTDPSLLREHGFTKRGTKRIKKKDQPLVSDKGLYDVKVLEHAQGE